MPSMKTCITELDDQFIICNLTHILYCGKGGGIPAIWKESSDRVWVIFCKGSLPHFVKEDEGPQQDRMANVEYSAERLKIKVFYNIHCKGT